MAVSGLKHPQQEQFPIFGNGGKKIGFSLVSFFNLLMKRITDFFSLGTRLQICITANYCLNVKKTS